MDNTTCVTQLNFFAVLLCARGTALKIATFVIWCGKKKQLKKQQKKNNRKQNKIPQQEKKQLCRSKHRQQKKYRKKKPFLQDEDEQKQDFNQTLVIHVSDAHGWELLNNCRLASFAEINQVLADNLKIHHSQQCRFDAAAGRLLLLNKS